jgi:predicted transcriptional regulator
VIRALTPEISLTAVEVLQAIAHRPRITPIMIAEELKYNQQAVRNVLLILSELGLVTKAARGVYEITPLGSQVLEKAKPAREKSTK